MPTILGLGCDIVKTVRFKQILERNPQRAHRLCARICHPSEQKDLLSLDHTQLSQKLANSWAAKEALYKALDFEAQKTCIFNQWRVETKSGRYMLVCDKQRNDHCFLSLSHDAGLTVATVLRQSGSEPLA